MRGSKQAAANRRNTLKSISGQYPRYRMPRQGWLRPGLRKADGVKVARPDATLSCNIPQINVLQCPKADRIQGILSAEPVLQSRSGDEICIAGSIRRPHSSSCCPVVYSASTAAHGHLRVRRWPRRGGLSLPATPKKNN